jgi:Na+/H+-dicarboxylate symporter
MQKGIKKVTRKAKKYQLAVIGQMLKLTTNAFGLVAALAWNNVIKELVEVYLKPLVGVGSGLISLIIYAIIVTALAVGITLQLSKIKEGLEEGRKK